MCLSVDLTRPGPCTQGNAGFNRFAHSAGPGIGDWRIGVHFFCNVGLVGLVGLAGLVGLVGLAGLIGPLGKEELRNWDLDWDWIVAGTGSFFC